VLLLDQLPVLLRLLLDQLPVLPLVLLLEELLVLVLLLLVVLRVLLLALVLLHLLVLLLHLLVLPLIFATIVEYVVCLFCLTCQCWLLLLHTWFDQLLLDLVLRLLMLFYLRQF
jgi:hypothetical protein